jgi:cell division septal protein FtsQ
LANNKKDGDRTSFLFDDEAGRDEETIDLFASDEEEPEEPQEDIAPEEPDGSDAEDREEPSERPAAPEKGRKKDKPSETPQFRFDRYGRRVGKKKVRYGKRKDAPKATTTVVRNETEAKREYDEARARSEARAKKRAREEEKQAELKRAERKRQRQRSMSTMLFGGLALVLLLGMTWFVTRLQKISVPHVPEGYTTQRIIDLSGLESSMKKKSALLISTRDVEQHIREADPYLDATVRYSFPSTISITVHKRDEAACVRWGPQNEYLAIIDESGTVLNAAAESANGLLIADGMSISSAVNGTRLGDTSDIQVAALVRLLTKLKELGLLDRTPRINRIDMTELMQIRMYVEGSSYTIEVGDTSNLETKLMLLQKHWTEIMDEASAFIGKGYSTATIYLYSKGGVNISPYESGHVIDTPAPPSFAPETPGPDGEQPGEQPTATPGEEDYTPEPQVTPMPHQDDPFTG